MDQIGYCTIKRSGQKKIYVRMKTKKRKQMLKKFREVKVQLYISVKLNLRSNQKISKLSVLWIQNDLVIFRSFSE